MPDLPECLNHRYKLLDELIRDLSSGAAGGLQDENSSSNVGIKLMCDFWNILKDDPECNLSEEVQNRMCGSRQATVSYGQQNVNCYMANKELDKANECKRQDAVRKIRRVCCDRDTSRTFGGISNIPSSTSERMPLSKVLCSLKEAASFDKKCNVRVSELMDAQKELLDQIQILEQKEIEGVKLLKQADCMWACMEDSYKKKIAESNEKQKLLLKELKEVEASSNKWRKNKKDLEFQLTNMAKVQDEITEKINQKNNDIKVMDMEIEDFKKRIERNAKDTEIATKALKTKKEASDAKIAKIASEIAKFKKKVDEEQKIKIDKEKEGTKYIKDVREDLQHMCKILLQKKLENEDLGAEKDALFEDIDLLQTAMNTCKDKCRVKESDMVEEIKKIEDEIANYKVKCIRCHECTDTIDIRKFCTDCPRCIQERDCLYEGDHCSPDHSLDCVCMSVKQKFLDNVFENMYTVLERQAKTNPGKAVADAVLNCLKRSRNGKLNQDTRKILQNFILTTVRKNLNLSIVGGAVKTRCEMDPDTYKQLMLCLKNIQVTKPSKEDKSTASRKAPCPRWGGPSECHCPKGPKACICTKKAPPPPHDPTPCGPPDEEDIKEADVTICPHKENTVCGPDCGMQGVPPKPVYIGDEVATWRPDPCAPQTCTFAKNMKTAQCVLGPETSIATSPKMRPTPPIIPSLPNTELMPTCSCGDVQSKPCACREDCRSQPRERIIEEVMGRYTEIPPIERVPSMAEHDLGESNSIRRIDTCDCSNLPLKYLLASNISSNKITHFCACSSNYVPSKVRAPYNDELIKKRHLSICRSHQSNIYIHTLGKDALKLDTGFKTSERNKVLRKTSHYGVKAILCPKRHHHGDKLKLSIDADNMPKSENAHFKFERKSSLNIDDDLKPFEASIFEKKVCETVKNLITDIVVPEELPKNELPFTDVQWVTLKSLFKEITSLTEIEDSNSEILNEVEVKFETLDDSKDVKLLIDENMCGLPSLSFVNNVIKMQQQNINDQNEGSHHLCKNIIISCDKYYDTMSEELKKQLLDDIQETSNISAKTSPANIAVKKPDFNTKKFKNIRKCLRNLEEATLENNDYTKHLKAEIKDNCNKNTCSRFLKQARSSHKPHRKDNLKKIPSVQRDVLYSGQNQDQIASYSSEKNQHNTKDQFKIMIESENGQPNDQFTELTKTKSGKLAIELDENIIELIEKKSLEEPYLYVSLTRTDSGHLLVDFDPKQNVTERQRVKVRRSPSGTRLLDVHQDMIKLLKNTISREKLDTNTSKSIKLSLSPVRGKKSSQNRENTVKKSLPIDSEEIVVPKHEEKTKKHHKDRHHSKRLLAVSKREEHIKSSIDVTWKSRVPVIKQINEECNCPPDALVTSKAKQPEIYQEKGEKCSCPPVNSIECNCKNLCKSKIPEECGCPLGPPITFKWKPAIIKKPSLPLEDDFHCDCPPGCKKLIIGNKYASKTECDCPEVSQNSSSWKTDTTKSVASTDEYDYVSELNQLYKRGNAGVIVKVRGKNGNVRQINTVITKTPSDTIAIYCRNIASLKDIAFDGKEYPVLLSRTISDTYFIDFGQYDKTLNAVIRKTPSEGILFVPKLKSVQGRSEPMPDEFFKVKVSGVRDHPVELPAVLKKTPSCNYIIVLDKEFEKRYRQTVNEYIGDRNECIVDLNRTNSGYVLIELNFEDDSKLVEGNALLVKSSSGNIKVLVHGPDFENIVQSVSKQSSILSAIGFKELINKLPASSRELHRENLRKSKFLEKKASSDTQLYENVRVKLRDNSRMLSEPSALLKKTPSGQYAIILNKESKKSFINNLQSYLTSNPQRLVPIKRTKSGEIIIILNNDEDTKGHYGSLKVTSSGNIYVVVDQEAIRHIAKDSKTSDKLRPIAVNGKSMELSKPIVASVNKGVTTTCNGKPDDCTCCDTSKCLCAELHHATKDWWSRKNPIQNYCPLDESNPSNDKPPHIVIKPGCDCGPSTQETYESEKQCYYLLDAVCPYHNKSRYDGVSNEILEISGLCKAPANSQLNKIECEADTEQKNAGDHQTWDALNYLPPQLPPFLSNINF